MAEEVVVDAVEDEVPVAPDAEEVLVQDDADVGKQGDEEDDVDFSWDDAADQDDSGEEADAEDDSGEYNFDLGEQTQIPEGIHGELGGLAKELGLPGDKAAQLLNRSLEIYQKAHAEMNRELGKELRKEWGADFDAKLKATKAYAVRLGKLAGLRAADMGAMMSPYGVRLLNAMREMVSEGGGFAGRAAQAAAPLTTQQKLDAFYANSEKMAAVLDPNHPLFESANRELNKLHGIS